MGLTLDELKILKSAILWGTTEIESKALKIIEREIKLKTIDPVTGKKIDVSGNPIFDGE